jgi:hypothetical protein
MHSRQTVGALFRFMDCGYGSSLERFQQKRQRFCGSEMRQVNNLEQVAVSTKR